MNDPIDNDGHTDRMERVRVVAWLRDIATKQAYGDWGISSSALNRAADTIENGGHYAAISEDDAAKEGARE